MRALDFVKMHGLGNDFVVLDARAHALALDADAARAIADRHRHRLRPAPHDRAAATTPRAAFMRIRNADGSEAEACGNGTRCVAALLMRARPAPTAWCSRRGAGCSRPSAPATGRIAVDMGRRASAGARSRWRASWTRCTCRSERSGRCATRSAPASAIRTRPSSSPMSRAIDLATLGPTLEHDPLFPERANIGVAQILSPERIRAARLGARRRHHPGLRHRRLRRARRGAPPRPDRAPRRGRRSTAARSTSSGARTATCMMTGPAATSFRGTLDPALLRAERWRRSRSSPSAAASTPSNPR